VATGEGERLVGCEVGKDVGSPANAGGPVLTGEGLMTAVGSPTRVGWLVREGLVVRTLVGTLCPGVVGATVGTPDPMGASDGLSVVTCTGAVG
jgi:hypothetical protein